MAKITPEIETKRTLWFYPALISIYIKCAFRRLFGLPIDLDANAERILRHFRWRVAGDDEWHALELDDEA